MKREMKKAITLLLLALSFCAYSQTELNFLPQGGVAQGIYQNSFIQNNSGFGLPVLSAPPPYKIDKKTRDTVWVSIYIDSITRNVKIIQPNHSYAVASSSLTGTFTGTLTEARQKADGYSTVVTTDYGGGTWYYDATDVSSSDNTGTIFVTSMGKRYKRIYSCDINVQWFGIIADANTVGAGGTDQSSKIKSLISLISTLNISTPSILFPAVYNKAYRIDSIVNFNISGMTVKGEGMFKTVIATTTAAKMIQMGSTFMNLRDIQFYNNYSGSDSIKNVFGTSASGCKFNNVRSYIRNATKGQYKDYCFYFTNSFYTEFSGCSMSIFPNADSPHVLTGLTTRLPSGGGLYSKNSNAMYVTDCDFTNTGVGIYSVDDAGINIKGGSMELFNVGVYFTGAGTKNSVSGMRFEPHYADLTQLQPFGQQASVILDTNVRQCVIRGNSILENLLYYPYNMSIIERGVKGGNEYDNIKGATSNGAQLFTPQTTNGLFKKWESLTKPSGWNVFLSSVTLSRENIDLPPIDGITDALHWSGTNSGGIASDTVSFDPAKNQNSYTIRFWAKRLSGTGMIRVGIWDCTNATYQSANIGLFNDPNATYAGSYNFASADQWTEYTIKTLIPTTTTARKIQWIFFNSGTCEMLVTGISVVAGSTNLVPGNFDKNTYFDASFKSQTYNTTRNLYPTFWNEYIQSTPTAGRTFTLTSDTLAPIGSMKEIKKMNGSFTLAIAAGSGVTLDGGTISLTDSLQSVKLLYYARDSWRQIYNISPPKTPTLQQVTSQDSTTSNSITVTGSPIGSKLKLDAFASSYRLLSPTSGAFAITALSFMNSTQDSIFGGYGFYGASANTFNYGFIGAKYNSNTAIKWTPDGKVGIHIPSNTPPVYDLEVVGKTNITDSLIAGKIKVSNMVAGIVQSSSVGNLFSSSTVAPITTFSASPIVPNPTTATQAINKGSVEALLAGYSLINLTTTSIIDFGSVSANSQLAAPSTVTLTGAAVGDAINVSAPNTDGIIYKAVVTSTNTITVYACNFTVLPIDPSSSTFKFVILR